MKFLEKDLEQIIYNADRSELYNRGLWVEGKMHRQLKIGNYGISDLVTIRRPHLNPYANDIFKGIITVFELKQEKITMSAFLQAVRYVKGIKSYLEKHKPRLIDYYNFEIVLIGRTLCMNSDVAYLADLFYFDTCEKRLHSEMGVCVKFYTYSYDVDGINFEDQSCFSLTNEGF